MTQAERYYISLTTDRSAKLAEAQRDANEERNAELQASYNNASLAKRKAEADFFSLQEEIEQLETDAKNADERAAKSASEVCKRFDHFA